MVAWFIIAIATLAVFALIAVNGVQTVAATTDGVGRVETTRRVEAAVAAISARIGSPNNTGNGMVPAGSTVDGVYGLPSELSAFASTPFGQRIVYCPFGPLNGESGTTTANIPSGTGGTSYQVQVKADEKGRVYVTSGRPAFPQSENPNLMAYLLAPRTKTSPTPTCASVRFNPNTSRFEAPDAIVRPVLRASTSEDQRQQASREVVYYVSQNGSGRGLTSTDPTSLYAALTYYRSAMPQAMRIVMTPDTYTLPAQFMNATVGGFSDKGNAGTLVMEGAGSQLSFTGTSDIWIPGNLELRNLAVSTAVGLWADLGHKLTLVNTSTGNVRIDSGGILQASNIVVTDTRQGWGILVNNGATASLRGTVDVRTLPNGSGVAVGVGSRTVFEGAAISISATSGSILYGILNEEGSDLSFRNSSTLIANAVQTPFAVKGRTAFYGGTVSTNVAAGRLFVLEGGGYLSLNGGTYGLGSAPQVTILDAGGSGVTGTGTMRATNACWNGNLFLQSAGGNGASSRVRDADALPGMSNPPTALEVQNHTAVSASNAQRAQLRNVNTSSYSCQM